MHRLATVHARDNQPTNQPTDDQRRHDTAYLNKRLFYESKVRRLIIIIACVKRRAVVIDYTVHVLFDSFLKVVLQRNVLRTPTYFSISTSVPLTYT